MSKKKKGKRITKKYKDKTTLFNYVSDLKVNNNNISEIIAIERAPLTKIFNLQKNETV